MRSHKRPALTFISVALSLCAGVVAVRSQGAGPRRLTSTPEHNLNMNPSLSGDGQHVAFESNAGISGASDGRFNGFRADVSGDAASFVRFTASRAPAPTISQDGSRIVFAGNENLTGRNADGNSEIFLFDGTNLRQLTDTAPADVSRRTRDGNFQPSISDDGRFVAFTSNRNLMGQNAAAKMEGFLYDASSQSFTQLTDMPETSVVMNVKISGDGTRAVYVEDKNAGDSSTTRRELVLLDLTTNSARTIVSGFAELTLTYGRAVSDDGTRVVFAAHDPRSSSQVFLHDGRNDAIRQLTFLGSRASDVPLHPTISGDGNRVAFATRRALPGERSDGSAELYLHDIPTNTTSRITNAPARATAETVSSLDDEGSTVAFSFSRLLSGPVASDDFENTSEIYLARLAPRPPFSTSLQILNGASFGKEPSTPATIAPDSIAVARGENFALTVAHARRLSDGTFPRSLANTTVTVNGRAAQLFYVSPAQVNFHVPPETEQGPAEVVVRNHDGYETRGTITTAHAAPGLFTHNGDGSGDALALDADTLRRGPFDAVDDEGKPRRLIIFTTGLGKVAVSETSVQIGGRAVVVEALVPSPDLPGLQQAHILLSRSFRGAGSLPLVIAAPGRASNSASVTFTSGGGSPRPASVTLTPSTATMVVGNGVRFRATVRDDVGEEIQDAPLNFSSSSSDVAVVDADGLARGVGPGEATIMATSGGVSASVRLRVVQRTVVINEVLADPPDGTNGDANRDGSRSASQDEFIELVNATSSDIDIGGHKILTRNSNGADVARHTFAPGTILAAGASAVVFGGARVSTFDPNNSTFGGALVQTASTSGLSLGNSGSTVTLLDAGGSFVDQFTYGDGSDLRGDQDQSLTRSPDVSGDFMSHGSTAASNGLPFSPGTRLDGVAFKPPVEISSVEVAPPTADIIVGAQQQFTARAFDASGREVEGVIFSWRSGSPAVATIDRSGLASGLAEGATEITASARGVQSGAARLTVRPERSLTRIDVAPASVELEVGGVQQFSARGFDQHGQEMTGLTFAWASSNVPVATIDTRGTATAIAPGTTNITASANDITSAPVVLVVREPLRVVRVEVSPLAASVNRGGVWQFTARAFDQHGQEARGAVFAWSSNAPAVASVDVGGLARGVGFGAATITASTPDGRGGTVSGQATIDVHIPLVVNEILADPPGSSPTDLNGDANRDGRRDGTQDEFVEFFNFSDASVDISGVVVTDATSNRHTFASNTVLAAGRGLVLFGGGAPDATDPAFGGSLVLAASSSSLGLNNDGDTLSLKLTVAGTPVVITSQSFGGSSGVPAPSDQSITRSPDAGPTQTGGNFVAHANAGNAAGRIFSPGTRADGAPFAAPALSRLEITPVAASVEVGASQVYTARAFADSGGVEVEVPNVSFVWDASETNRATLAPVTGASSTVTGLVAGDVTIRARAGGRQAMAALIINAPPPVLTRIEISPASASIMVGATQAFTAKAFDQYGSEMSGVSFEWASSATDVATIDRNGLATGRRAGTSDITARAGSVVSNTASLTVVAASNTPRKPLANEIIINEVFAATSANGDANRDGTASGGNDQRDEFVELVNVTNTTLDLSGLNLYDNSTTIRHTFPVGTILQPGKSLVVFAGESGTAASSNIPGIPAGTSSKSAKEPNAQFGGAIVQVASAYAFGTTTSGLQLNNSASSGSAFADCLRLVDGTVTSLNPLTVNGTLIAQAFYPAATTDKSFTRTDGETGINRDFTSADLHPAVTVAPYNGKFYSPGLLRSGNPFP